MAERSEYRQASRWYWYANGNPSSEQIQLGAIQRMADALEGIEKRLTRICRLLDPHQRAKLAEERVEKAQQAESWKRYKVWMWVEGRERKRIAKSVQNYFAPAKPNKAERAALKKVTAIEAERVLQPVPWAVKRAREPTEEERTAMAERATAFDPTAVDWEKVGERLTDLMRGRLLIVINRLGRKDTRW